MNAIVGHEPKDKTIKGIKKSFDAWEVENALDCLKRAAQIKADPEMTAAVKKMARARLAEAQASLAIQKKLAS